MDKNEQQGACQGSAQDGYVSPELLAQFKQIYLKEFGEELSDEAALARAVSLTCLFAAIYRRIPADKARLCHLFDEEYNESAKPTA